MRAVRVLAAAGLVSAALSTLGGFVNLPVLVGLAGLTMLVANLFALVSKK